MLDYLEKHENAKCMPNVTSVKFAPETFAPETFDRCDRLDR